MQLRHNKNYKMPMQIKREICSPNVNREGSYVELHH